MLILVTTVTTGGGVFFQDNIHQVHQPNHQIHKCCFVNRPKQCCGVAKITNMRCTPPSNKKQQKKQGNHIIHRYLYYDCNKMKQIEKVRQSLSCKNLWLYLLYLLFGLLLKSTLIVKQFQNSNCVTRAPLLYFIRSLLALSLCCE